MIKNYFFLLCFFMASLAFSQEAKTDYSASKNASQSAVVSEIKGLEIFPNPVTQQKVNIVTKQNGTKIIGIYDVFGKQVLSKTIESKTLYLNSLIPGVYILKITEGNSRSTRKLIIR